ncbi:iron ABC transporter permease [Tumebacillus sp. ITR2]|uniref:Iron ABC transporter permease n=1 Tax=Tumebacillus amylolyticus TaxID=2801339 RepID=A0ABS1J5P7_9BACL|nr:iron ABC transporter permease [Tumebacillus amylolyticus]MBL0385354.1 iron ABC transporter permease [Tumebacillus amylolyticus]
MKQQVQVRNRRFSFLVERKSLVVLLALLILTFAVVVVSTGVGQVQISPLRVLNVFLGDGTKQEQLIVHDFRLPRTLLSVLVGVALAVSGAILQGILRNPLASPDVIGVTGGASVAAVLVLTVFEGVSISWLPVAAMLGAILVTALVYVFSWSRGIAPLRLVLVGVGVGAAMTALTTMMVVMSPMYLTARAVTWMAGSVYGASWGNVFTMTPWVVLFVVLAMFLSRSMNAQQMGDEVATGIGNPVQRDRLLLLVVCCALAGSAVAAGGAIGFVGLLAPHISRKLVGPGAGVLLPVSGLVGALIVLVSDLIARTAFAPLDLPVGIFTASVGAPFFIYLLYKNRNS